MTSLPRSLLVLALGAALLGCSKTEDAEPAKPGGAPPPKVAKATAPPPMAVGSPGTVVAAPQPPPVFAYDPVGLRDPFVPFIKFEDTKKRAPQTKTSEPGTPLQQYSTEQLKLAGVVWGGEGKPRALIEDPQGKGYAVGVGTLIGDRGGKVIRIQPDRVVIEERFTDLFGEEKKNVSNIMLHKPEGEVAR